MSAESLLNYYEKIIEAPDAIDRLRRFILDLAIRGKLVPQDPRDEPASELLTRIAKEKARAGKREKVETEIDNGEELGELPRTWRAVPLIALGFWAIGSGFPKNEQGSESGPHFFLKVSDMNLPGNEKYITTSNNCIDDDAAQRMRAKIHPPGTIIFPKIGGAIATNKRRILTRGSAIDNNCLGITFSSALNIEWAFLLLTTLDFTRYQAGTAVPALQQGVLERIPVGLPPLAEQHRIVAKVDELMALCNQLEAARAKRETTRDQFVSATLDRLTQLEPESFKTNSEFAITHLALITQRQEHVKKLRKTILDLAVRGKLVPQDPNDEPAATLMSQIKTVRHETAKKGRQITKELSNQDFESGGETPLGWEVVTLGEVVKIRTGKLDANAAVKGGKYPFFTCSNSASEIDTYSFDTGAVLLAGNGDFNLKVYRGKFDAYQRTYVIEPIIWNLQYCFILFRSEISRITVNHRGSAIPYLKLGDITSPIIFLPPLNEQRRIVAKVDELMALCDQLEDSLTAESDRRSRLLAAALAQALEASDREAA